MKKSRCTEERVDYALRFGRIAPASSRQTGGSRALLLVPRLVTVGGRAPVVLIGSNGLRRNRK
jgi:hypothetical protein